MQQARAVGEEWRVEPHAEEEEEQKKEEEHKRTLSWPKTDHDSQYEKCNFPKVTSGNN